MAKLQNLTQSAIVMEGARLKIKDRSQSNPVTFDDLPSYITSTQYRTAVPQLEKKGFVYIVGLDNKGLPMFLLPEDKLENLYWQAYNYEVEVKEKRAGNIKRARQKHPAGAKKKR